MAGTGVLEDVAPTGDVDEFRHPADRRDAGVWPLLEVDARATARAGRLDAVQMGHQFVDEGGAGFGGADEGGGAVDGLEDFRDGTLIEDHHRDAPPGEFPGDVSLEIREADDEVWLQRHQLVEVGVEEGADPRLGSGFRWPHREARNADDAITEAQPIQGLGGLFRQAGDALRHPWGIAQEYVDDIHSSDVYRGMPLNQSLVGKRYPPPDAVTVPLEGAAAFALATNAPVSGAHVPPMLSVTWALPALGAVLFDPLLGVDMMRLLHGEHDVRFGAPVVAGDAITSVATIEGIDRKAAGELLDVRITSKNGHGVVVADAVASIFIRGPRQRDPRTVDAPAGPDPFLALPTRFHADVVVAADQALRYANASGDHNPIHLDEEAARQAGLPGCILHGLCTMAFVFNAVAEAAGGSDKVRRLKVRFARPVLLGDTLGIDGRSNLDGSVAVRVTNQSGIVVIDDGRAELA